MIKTYINNNIYLYFLSVFLLWIMEKDIVTALTVLWDRHYFYLKYIKSFVIPPFLLLFVVSLNVRVVLLSTIYMRYIVIHI